MPFSPFFPHSFSLTLKERMPLLAGSHAFCLFGNRKQRRMFLLFGIESDGAFRTGFDTLWISSAEITDIHNVLENFYGSDRAESFTGSADVADRRRGDHLIQFSEGQSLFRTAQTEAFPTLTAEYGAIYTNLIEAKHLDSGFLSVDSSSAEKSAGHFAPPASRAARLVNGYHFSALDSIDRFQPVLD
jgi:hypothetical protein